MRCDGCGANLDGHDLDSGNVKCEYCGSVSRVRDAGEFDAAELIAQIAEIAKISAAAGKDNFESRYQHITGLIDRHEYRSANDTLNEILKDDHEQSRAWYYKSLLPILEQESVLFRGCYINIRVYSILTKRDDQETYLRRCGLPWYRHRAFREFYRSTDFLYEQQMKFIDNAIKYARSEDSAKFLEKQRTELIARKKRSDRKYFFGIGAFFFVLAALVTFTVVFLTVILPKWKH